MWWTCAAGQAVHNLNVTGSKCWQLLNIHHLPYHQPSWTGQWKFKPVINWANVCSRTELEVFGEASWFLIGQTFLREPSWKYSGSKKLRSTCSGNIRPIRRSLPLTGWEQSSPVDEGGEKKRKKRMTVSLGSPLASEGICLFVDLWEAQPCLGDPEWDSS